MSASIPTAPRQISHFCGHGDAMWEGVASPGGGITLRLSDRELRGADWDGYGRNWPLCHRDLDPHYTWLEQFLAVRGRRDGLSVLPDGCYRQASPLTAAEQHMGRALARHRPQDQLIVSRGFALEPNLDGQNPWPRRASQGAALARAMATGRCHLVSGAAVNHVAMGKGRAEGVVYRAGSPIQDRLLRARLVVLCASTIESLRILLHSGPDHRTPGLPDPVGLTGRGLMDHVSVARFFHLPGVAAAEATAPLSGAESFFIPHNGSHSTAAARGWGRPAAGLWAVGRCPAPGGAGAVAAGGARSHWVSGWPWGGSQSSRQSRSTGSHTP